MTRQPDTLGLRLKLARTRVKMNQTELAKQSGMKQPDISKIERGEIQKTTGIARLARALGIEPDWLELGDGPMTRAAPTTSSSYGVSEPIGVAGYGTARFSVSQQQPQAHGLSHIEPIVTPKPTMVWEDLVLDKIQGQFAMAIEGEALMPTYPSGQMAVWEAGSYAKPGQGVLLHLPDGSFKIRWYQERGTSWAGVSERRGHDELLPDKHGAQIVARLRMIDFG